MKIQIDKDFQITVSMFLAINAGDITAMIDIVKAALVDDDGQQLTEEAAMALVGPLPLQELLKVVSAIVEANFPKAS